MSDAILISPTETKPAMISSALATSIMISPALAQAQSVPTRSLGSPLWDLAGRVPSLDLNFAQNRSLVDTTTGLNLITFSRTSEKWVTGSNGSLIAVPANTPAFDHNPITGESLGLLVEEQRTNEVRNSNNMSAVVTGSPGTLPTGWSAQVNSNGWTREVVGSGSIGTLNYVDIRFSGTPTTGQFGVSFQSQGVVAASNGQSWAPSVYYQLVGGSIGNIGCFPAANLWNSSVAFISSVSVSGSMSPTSTLQRFTGSSTINNAAAAFISWGITFTCTIGNTYDFTIRFAGPQLEQGAFATSVIPTSGTAVTRAADVCSISGSNFSSWYRQDEGTVFVDAASIYNGGRYFMFDNGTGNERWEGRFSSYVTTLNSWSSGIQDISTSTLITSASPALNVKGAYANASNNAAVADNSAGSVIGVDPSSTMPAAQSRMWIGSYQGTATFANGPIRRLTYWPQRLPNATLQAITA